MAEPAISVFVPTRTDCYGSVRLIKCNDFAANCARSIIGGPIEQMRGVAPARAQRAGWNTLIINVCPSIIAVIEDRRQTLGSMTDGLTPGCEVYMARMAP